MPIELLVHTNDPAAERRSADRRASDRRTAARQDDDRRSDERRSRWSSAPPTIKAPTAIPEGKPLPRVATRERRYRRALVVADAVAASIALLASWLVAGLPLSPAHLLVPLAAVLALEAGDLYDRDDLVLRRSTLDEAPSLLQFAALATIAAAVIGGRALDPYLLVAFWLIMGLALVLARAAARAVVRRILECERCLVIGDESWPRTCAGRCTPAAPAPRSSRRSRSARARRRTRSTATWGCSRWSSRTISTA